MHRFYTLAISIGLVVGAAACDRDTRTATDQRLDEAQRTVEQKTDQAIEYGRDVGRDVRDEARELRDDLRATPDRSAQLPPAQDPWENTRPEAPPMNEPEPQATAEPEPSPGITNPSTSEGTADDFSSQPSVMGQLDDTEPTEPSEPAAQTEPPVTEPEPFEPTDQPPVTAEPSTTIDPSAPAAPSTELDPSAPPMAAEPAPDEDSVAAQTEPGTEEADRAFQLDQQNRIATLTGVHATIASQPAIIKAAAVPLALSESDRALVDEKVQELQRRIDETSTLIMSLDRVAPSNWTARNDVVDDAMRRLDASRDAAWQALHDAANHAPTSMR